MGLQDRNALIEAKNPDSCDAVRAAIGQLYDYRRFHEPPGLARRRVVMDRYRDRKTKVRLGFPPGRPRLPATTAQAQITVCGPLAA